MDGRRRTRIGGRLPAVASIVALGLVTLGGPWPTAAAPAGDECSWSTMRSANAGERDNDLRAVTAISRNDVWTVGSALDGGSSRPMAQHWDGERWEVVPSAPPEVIGSLLGVGAASSSDVWAVGSSLSDLQTSHALALHWDGRTWDRVNVPRPEPGRYVSTVLTDVFAIGPDDAWAVGTWSPVPDHPPSTLTAHWDGRSWEVVEGPDLGTWSELRSVTATGPDDVWAVGNTEVVVSDTVRVERALFEHWDGNAWKVVPTPFVARRAPFTLESVDAHSGSDAWAVGVITRRASIDTLAFHWDGDRWTEVPTIDRSDVQFLSGVAVAGPKQAWAVGTSWDEARGTDVTLVERWDGERWVEVPSDSRPSGNQLIDVDLLPSKRSFAVGSFWANGGDGPQRTLVLRGCTR